MKVLFLLTQDLESPSGLGRFWPLARELARLGHQVTIAALHSNFDRLTARRFERDGVGIWYVAPMHVRKAGNVKQYYSPLQLAGVILRATWTLSRAALSIPADVIVIAKPHPMNGIAGLLGHWLRGGKLALDCDDYEAGSGHFSGKWQRKGIEFFEKYLPQWADIVTTHTDFMRQMLIGWGVAPDKIHFLPNGVDRTRFAAPLAEEPAALRQTLALEAKQVVLFVGSLSMPSHPVDLLFGAFQKVLAQHPETVLVLVGGGDQFDVLQQMAQTLGISHAVRFCGRVAPEQVPQYYALADVSVDPVHDDEAARGRAPLKLFESWAAGVPFVTANVGERAALAGDPPAIWLCQPGSADSLADALLQVLSNPELAENLRQLGLSRVPNYFWDQLVQPLETAFQNLVQAKQRRA